ncbi:hypothetical protein Tco_0066867, partial [Tanacetum coccineum]
SDVSGASMGFGKSKHKLLLSLLENTQGLSTTVMWNLQESWSHHQRSKKKKKEWSDDFVIYNKMLIAYGCLSCDTNIG